MNEETNPEQFYKTLCYYSENKAPALAILEWEFENSSHEENHCICGMKIFENCHILNIKNGNRLIVGNVCVNKFLEKDYSFIFKAIKAIKQNKMPNKSFINYCFDKGYIYETQKDFLLNIHRKRKLTKAQQQFKSKLLYKLKMMERW